MVSDSNKSSAEQTLQQLIESAGEDRVKASGRTRLGLKQARDTLDTLLEEAGLGDLEDLKAQLNSRHSTKRAMNALFADPHPSGEFVDLDGDDGVVDENGVPTHLAESSLPPQLAGTEPTPPPRPIRELEDDIDFWVDLETDTSGSNGDN